MNDSDLVKHVVSSLHIINYYQNLDKRLNLLNSPLIYLVIYKKNIFLYNTAEALGTENISKKFR